MQERLTLALESAEVGVWDLDLVTDTAFRSLRHDQIFGYSTLQPQWGREIFLTHVVPEDRPLAKESFEKAFETGLFGMECRIARKNDQSIRWISAEGKIFKDPTGRPIRMMGTVADITHRHLTEEYELFFRTTTDLIAIADLDGRFRRLNPSWERVTGMSDQELRSRPWIEFVHPEDRRETAAQLSNLARGLPVSGFENRYRCKDGSYRWLSWQAPAPLPGSTRIFATARDVTERKRADERMRLVVEASPSAMIMVDQQGRICLLNAQTEALFGYPRAELLGQPLELLMPQRFREGHAGSRTEFLKHPRARAMAENRALYGLRKDGAEVPIEIGLNPITIEGSGYVLASVVDISERKRTQELEKIQARLEATLVERGRMADRLAARSAWTLILSEEGSFEDACSRLLQSICETFQWALGELWTVDPRNQRIHRLRDWHLPEPGLEEFGKAAAEGPWYLGTGIAGSVGASGKVKWIEDVAKENICPRTDLANRVGLHGAFSFPIISDNRVIAVMSFFSRRVEKEDKELLMTMADLSHQIGQSLARQRLRASLAQAQKMEAIGRLTGGIAHDFNNMLTVINGYSELLLGRLLPGEPYRDDLEQILKSGERASSLTRQLLAFSRNQVLDPKVLDLNQVVREMERMLKRMIGEDIDLVSRLEPELASVKADPGQVGQVLMNLAVNARDAMPQGGKLTLETANVELSEGFARTHMTVVPGPYVMLAVSDTGTGMDPETQAHLFEPFYTTKERGKGTGLGLATVYGIVKQSGGSIWVYSEPGHGSTFKIYLPRVPEAADDRRKAAAPPNPRGSETCLLVEDEVAVRQLSSKILRSHGYTVLEAESGIEALWILGNHTGTIHLLMTDVVMPGMSGRELAEKAGELHPTLPVLFVSGYTSNAIVRHGVLETGINFLQKPFTPDGLLRKVREVLDAKELPQQGP